MVQHTNSQQEGLALIVQLEQQLSCLTDLQMLTAKQEPLSLNELLELAERLPSFDSIAKRMKDAAETEALLMVMDDYEAAIQWYFNFLQHNREEMLHTLTQFERLTETQSNTTSSPNTFNANQAEILQQLQDLLGKLENAIKHLDHRIKQLDNEIIKLKDNKAELSKEINLLKKDIDDHRENHSENSQPYVEKLQKIASLQNQLDQFDRKINSHMQEKSLLESILNTATNIRDFTVNTINSIPLSSPINALTSILEKGLENSLEDALAKHAKRNIPSPNADKENDKKDDKNISPPRRP